MYRLNLKSITTNEKLNIISFISIMTSTFDSDEALNKRTASEGSVIGVWSVSYNDSMVLAARHRD